MHTLWNRVAQFKGSCRCPQCVTAAHAVARGTTASATKRSPRFLTSSTLWYSGIFAAAATFDAGAKKRRREQWDHAIAEVRQELLQPLAGEEKMDARVRGRAGQRRKFPFLPVDPARDLGDNLDSSALRGDVPHWPVNTGLPLDIHNLPPQSIYAARNHKERRKPNQWVPKKLERVQLSVDALQLQMIQDLRRRGLTEEAALTVPISYRGNLRMPGEEIDKALKQKLSDIKRLIHVNSTLDGWQRDGADVPLCTYAQDGRGDFRQTTHRLNASLQELFRLEQVGHLSRSALLAKICHNLSISTAPPDVDTYNTLILGFWKARETKQAKNVIGSFFATNVRPNEVSLASILGFYTDTDDLFGFKNVLLLMRGKRGGLMEASKGIKITHTGQVRLLQRENASHKVVQLPYPTPMVFGALVRGILKFSSFEEALTVCQNMGKEGWGLCMNGLGSLLQDCAQRSDWTSGLAVWQQIEALKPRSKTQARKDSNAEIIGLSAYVSMLQLCSKCAKRDIFDSVADQAINDHPTVATELEKLVRSGDQKSEMWDLLVENTSLLSVKTDNSLVKQKDPSGIELHPVNEHGTRNVNHLHSNKEESLCDGTKDQDLKTQDSSRQVSAGSPSGSRVHNASHVSHRRAYLRTPSNKTSGLGLDMRQLLGHMPSSKALDTYDLYERPMQTAGQAG